MQFPKSTKLMADEELCAEVISLIKRKLLNLTLFPSR
jgi:hypothetical protein